MRVPPPWTQGGDSGNEQTGVRRVRDGLHPERLGQRRRKLERDGSPGRCRRCGRRQCSPRARALDHDAHGVGPNGTKGLWDSARRAHGRGRRSAERNTSRRFAAPIDTCLAPRTTLFPSFSCLNISFATMLLALSRCCQTHGVNCVSVESRWRHRSARLAPARYRRGDPGFDANWADDSAADSPPRRTRRPRDRSFTCRSVQGQDASEGPSPSVAPTTWLPRRRSAAP